MKSVNKEDHPDFIGGIVWSRLELEWIRNRDKEWETELAAAKSTANNLAMSVMSDQVSNDSYSLFLAAIRDLAAINEHLGLDPDDGGAVPIIEAIDRLREQLTAAEKDGARWNAIETLMQIGNVELNQDDDGGYSIGVDPVENFAGQIWRGNTPEEAIDTVVEQFDAAMKGEEA